MAGLDTRGFMGGFAQGFGMMDQYQHRQWQKEQTEKQAALQQERLGIQDERYAAERAFREQQHADALANQKDLMGIRQAQHKLAQQQHDDSTTYQQQVLGLKQGQHEQQSKINDLKINQAENQQYRTDDENFMKGVYANMGTSGQMGLTEPEDLKRFGQVVERNPDLVAAPLRNAFKTTMAQRQEHAANADARNAATQALGKLFTPGQTLTTQDEEALLKTNNDITRAAVPEAMDAVKTMGRLADSSDPTEMNSPEVLDAANLVWGDMIGEGKRIIGMYPGKTPGTIAFDLSVDGEEESKPMTAGRGTAADGDDTVMEVKVEDLIDDFNGFASVAVQFAVDDEARNQALTFANSRGLYAAKESKAIPSREIFSSYTDRLQKITSDAELSMLPEKQQEAINSLRLNTAMSLGIHPSNIERALYLNSRGELTKAQLDLMAQPLKKEKTPDTETEATKTTQNSAGLTPPPPAGLTPPEPQSAPENRPVFHWQGDIENQMEERKQQEARQAEKRQQQEAEAQRKQTITGIQQRLKQLAPAVQAGDPAAQQLAQKLSAQLRDTLNSQ